jgi:hypothetical protein
VHPLTRPAAGGTHTLIILRTTTEPVHQQLEPNIDQLLISLSERCAKPSIVQAGDTAVQFLKLFKLLGRYGGV